MATNMEKTFRLFIVSLYTNMIMIGNAIAEIMELNET